MSRIHAAFAAAGAESRAALLAFLAAGDPDLATMEVLARAAAEAGADILELGIPFSDPLADGPVIQAAYTRALAGGVRVRAVLELTERVVATTGRPVVLMTALNPVLAYGPEAFCRAARDAGAAGLLVPDLLPEDAGELRNAAGEASLDTVFLASPAATPERLQATCAASTGFVYLLSRRGVTGQGGPGAELETALARVRRYARVPVAVGFGVSSAADAARVAAVADGVIVGSALVAAAHEAGGRAAAARAVGIRVAALVAAIRGVRSAQGETSMVQGSGR
jgi:tryptophan synthase alpha chain